MTLSPIPEKAQGFVNKKNEYIKLVQGPNVIRVLDEDYFLVDTHFINMSSILCLGEDCPICANNRLIIRENPETFRDVKGYYPKSGRYYLNVLDRTPTKVCPNCGEEVKHLQATACPKCNTMIVSTPALPLNKVKILAKGKQLFEQLVQLETAILDDEGNRLGLTNFDITLMVAGSGKTTTTTPIYNGRPGVPVDLSVIEKFDLSNATLKLTPSEIKEFLKGVSVKDIFTARKLEKETAYSNDFLGETPDSLANATQSALDLFK